MQKPNKTHVIGALSAAACAVLLACSVALPAQFSLQDGTAQTPAVYQQQTAPDADRPQAPGNPEDGDAAVAADGADAVDDPAVKAGVYDGETVLVSIPAGAAPEEAVAAIAEEAGLSGLALADDGVIVAGGAGEPTMVELVLPAGVGVQDAVERIGTTSVVDDVQPNFLYYIQDDGQVQSSADKARDLVPQTQLMLSTSLVTQAINVPDAENLWGLKSINAYKGAAGSAWEEQRADNSVAVAVIDEGFDVNHVDLKPNVKRAYNATNGSSNVAETAGQRGHGTHVAGIVSARANNNMGVAGVSYNADLVLIKVADASGTISSSSVVKAFDFAVANKAKHNIRVINMSIGGKWTSYSSPDSNDKAMLKAIDRAVANNIAVVCSAGNSDSGRVPFIDFPADYDSVIGVINLEQSGSGVRRSANSNYNVPGSTPKMPGGKNISAPGTDIKSTTPGSKYGLMSGTSMAAPHVSGALALAFAKNRNLSARDAASLLYSTATDIGSRGWDRDTGYGELNVYAMVADGAYLSGETTVQAGASIALTPSVSGSWTWASSDTGVARVSNGTVTGVNGGKARISATGTIDGKQTTLYKDVFVYKASISGAGTVQMGKTIRLTAESTPAGCWSWSTSDKSIATVNDNGVVTGVKVGGTATITARLSSNANIAVSKKITVSKSNISDATVSAAVQLYTGKALKPVPVVKMGGKTLRNGTDYTVTSYKNNVRVGTATVVVTGKGDYTGSKAGTFRIVYRPSCTGASQVPVGATAAYSVSNGSIAIKSGGGFARLSGKTLTGTRAGTVVLSVRDAAGVERATKKVTIFALSGNWELRSAVNTSYALDISGASKKTGANVQIYRSNKTPAQRFRFTANGDGTFRIANIKSWKVIDVSGGSRANCVNIQQWPWNTTNAQRWRMTVDASNRITLTNKGSNRVLDVCGARAANCTNVWQYASNGTKAQKWVLVRA